MKCHVRRYACMAEALLKPESRPISQVEIEYIYK